MKTYTLSVLLLLLNCFSSNVFAQTSAGNSIVLRDNWFIRSFTDQAQGLLMPKVRIKDDGPVISQPGYAMKDWYPTSVPNTGGWQNWKSVTTTVSCATGKHDLYLVFKGSNTGHLFNFDYWQFSKKAESDLSIQKTGSARNPIIWSDFPDPSVIRVGDTYYMSNTTMHMCPGVPIMKSKDLVNWKMVGYAYQKLEDNDETTLQNGKNMYGKGSWASSLRYYNGMYYVMTFALNTGKTYIFKTPDIESGKWTETSFKPLLYDGSLFFDDDGRVYIMCGTGDIRLVELNADLSGIKLGGYDQVIIKDASKIAGTNLLVPAEGAHLHKINGKYYLFLITWPKNDIRTQLVFRADKITGPYEGRVFLHDQGVAEGCMIDTPNGGWYAMLFQDNGAVGRTPFLVPMKWEDGWPVADNNSKVPQNLNIKVTNTPVPASVASDEFNKSTSQLGLQWQWNHNPDNRFWSLTQRPGFLRLTTGRVDNNFEQVRNMLTQRTFGPVCSGRIAVDVSNMKDGDVAGLAALQKRYGIVGVKMTGAAKSIVMISAESESPVELASVPLTQKTVYLKVDCNFDKKIDKAYFYYSLDGKLWTSIGEPLQMSYSLTHFVGYRFTLFNYSTKVAGGFVDFDYFRVSNEIGEQ
jgi:beta-xylosidase